MTGRSSRRQGAELPFDAEGALRALRASDAKLASLIERVGPLRLRIDPASSPFEALTESIVYQQISGRAAETILSRFKERVGDGRFPRPERVLETPDTALREAGLSRGKSAALRDLAQKTLDGTLPPLARLKRMEDGEVVERLTVVRGIGPWTAEMFLIFRLGRPDVLPIHDYGIRKGFQRTFRTRGIPGPAAVARRGERWRPFRTVASWYLWRALE